jgi:hypothetical protein
MNSQKRLLIGLAIFLALSATFYIGRSSMHWNNSHLQDLRRLLTSSGAILVEDADISAWEPDANYKPQAYYFLRAMDEASFARLAKQIGITAAPTPEVTEGIWRLPGGLGLQGWIAQDIPPGSGQQASGTVGAAAVWLRWYRGQMYGVVLPSSP